MGDESWENELQCQGLQSSGRARVHAAIRVSVHDRDRDNVDSNNADVMRD